MDGKDGPSRLPARSWRAVVRRTARELLDDELSDRAAALTYYGVPGHAGVAAEAEGGAR